MYLDFLLSDLPGVNADGGRATQLWGFQAECRTDEFCVCIVERLSSLTLHLRLQVACMIPRVELCSAARLSLQLFLLFPTTNVT